MQHVFSTRSSSVALSLALAGALTCLLVAPAAAEGEDSRPQTPSTYQAPTAEQIAAKRAEAAALAAQAADQRTALAQARSMLDDLQVELDAAVAAEDEAREREQAARADVKAQEARLAEANSILTDRKASAGALAAKAYRGDRTRDADSLIALMTSTDSTDDIASRLHTVELVGQVGATDIADSETARAVQTDATARSEAAAAAADAAHADAEAAGARAQDAVQRQTSQMMVIDALLARTTQAAATADAEGNKMAQEKAEADAAAARAAAAAAAAAAARAQQSAAAGPVDPNCTGGSLAGLANGRIPADRLCPLYGAPGHRLRADAAKSFNDMSVAYAGEFGAPICVTDSYRSYALQVTLKRTKPNLAAVPGTSNHGLARAVDLCGGIQDFDTPQYKWMQAHAGDFGWCAPYWARSNGSKPEAWHWQYRDCVS